jgi:hypothetical protein
LFKWFFGEHHSLIAAKEDPADDMVVDSSIADLPGAQLPRPGPGGRNFFRINVATGEHTLFTLENYSGKVTQIINMTHLYHVLLFASLHFDGWVGMVQ